MPAFNQLTLPNFDLSGRASLLLGAAEPSWNTLVGDACAG